ncbi:MAG TPA: peptidoglycan DD-metalloendopeptidase family protein [Candidatus Limnocylindrales bacterium]|nr:peptidoglycan DD-metalloendopeptidase family protein [Candidatus Limnocylindrales bacterium]
MRHSTPDAPRPAAARRSNLARRMLLLLLAVTTFGGMFVTSNPLDVSADALSDAYAKQKALQKLIDQQKATISQLAANQKALSGKISGTKHNLSEINANLLTVRIQIVQMTVEVAKSQNAVDEVAATAARLDDELADVESQEAAMQSELDSRMTLLASRIKESYNSDRTSILETMLSSADFTDALTEVGYQLDFAQQDKLLADQIIADRKVLTVLHENVVLAQQQADEMHAVAKAAKAELDAQMSDLSDARKQLVALENETQRLLAQQQAAYAKIAANKAKAAALLAEQLAAQKKLEKLVAKLVAEQIAKGGIPSKYNGTLSWPMPGRITQNFGCTGFSWEPAYGGCSHFHRGIDIANTMYTPIRAAGPGKVIWSGRSPYDSAWIVIIAHSSKLVSWYAHIDNKAHPPVVHAGQYVAKGQLIAYEGMTGRTTGPHLHWAVQLDGTWVNPRLFLPR